MAVHCGTLVIQCEQVHRYTALRDLRRGPGVYLFPTTILRVMCHTVGCYFILRIVLRITDVQSITNSYQQHLHDCLQNNLKKHKHCRGMTNLETICKRTGSCLDACLNDSNLSHDWNIPDIYCRRISRIAQDPDMESFDRQSRRLFAGSIEGLFQSLAAEQPC